ncbi:MAG: vitamin B12 dependent methionine synthase activation domain protein [bacterium]|nr:MAG: vitamin B12 dependent methionine synthase activation domain protein [bacterium]
MIESLNKTIMLENIPLNMKEVRILREMRIPGAGSLDELPEQNIALYIKNAIDLGYALIDSKVVYRTFPLVCKKGETPGLEDSRSLFFGKKIAGLLEGCDYVSLLIATIGPALPDRADELKKIDPTDSFFLEHVGGWAADHLAEITDVRIQAECAKNGYKTTRRYSPGYGDWTLDAQPEIMRLLDSGKIGVSLTDTKIMIPRKSVSAAIGWLPNR